MKHFVPLSFRNAPLVAPLAGAWIETSYSAPCLSPHLVAPLAGAWIETSLLDKKTTRLAGRPPRGGVD